MPKINEPSTTKKPSEIQSVIFDIKLWDESKAKKWLNDNDFSGLIADTESNGDYIRFRQHNPNRYKNFKTIESGKDGIKFILGFTKFKKQINDIINENENKTNDYNVDFDAIRLYCEKQLIENDITETIIFLIENYNKHEWIQISQLLSRVFHDVDYKLQDELSKIRFAKKAKEKAKETKQENIKDNRSVSLLKNSMDNEKRLVYGVVIEPKLIDTDNDWTDEKEIENACHMFMKYFQESGIDHEFVVEKGLKIVENYIAQSNFNINGVVIKKGSWIMVHYVENDEIWERIKNGDLNGYSFEGLGMYVNQKPN